MAVTVVSGDTPEQVTAALNKAGMSPESVEQTGPQDSAETPAADVKEEAPAPTEAAKPENEGKTSEGDSESSHEDQEKPRGEDGRFKPKEPQDAVDKRIGKAVAKQREAERKLAEAERKLEELQKQVSSPDKKDAQPEKPEPQKPSEPAPKPKLDDFPSYEDWTEAVAEWKAELKANEKVAKALEEIEKLKSDLHKKDEERAAAEKAADEAEPFIEAFNERLKETTKRHPDYNDAIKSADLPLIPKGLAGVFDDFIYRDSEIGPEVVYFLAKNPDELERIVELSPTKVIRELGKIEDKILAELSAEAKKPEPEPKKTPETPKPKLSAAPPPIKPVQGTATTGGAKKPSEMSFREYEMFLKTPEGERYRKGLG